MTKGTKTLDNIWPKPQQIIPGTGRLTLGGKLDVVVDGQARWVNAAARRAAAVIRPALRKAGGSAAALELTVTDMDSLAARGKVKAVRHDEGYVLAVTRRGVTLAGADAAGAFYGAQTLKLMLAASDGSLPVVTIRDWPRHPIRGAHMYIPGRSELEFFPRLLDMLAELKYNTIFMEIGAGMEFRRHPEINQAWKKFVREADHYDPAADKHRKSKRKIHPPENPFGASALQCSRWFPKNSTHTELGGGKWLTRAETRQVVAACAKRHIKIVPEVQSLSHCYWLCMAYPEIAERRDDPWPDTYCPSNPRSYELLFEAMDEIIEVFRPEMIHIGHDELLHLAHCPRCKGKSGADLLAADITKIHDYLAERGIRTVMWADKLMKVKFGGCARSRTESETGRKWSVPATYKAIDKIPTDVLMMDWYWHFGQEASQDMVDVGIAAVKDLSPTYFEDHGFEKVFGNYVGHDFVNWNGRSRRQVLGAEVSSWCALSPEALGHNRVVSDYHLSINNLWNGRQETNRKQCAATARWLPAKMDTLEGESRWIVTGEAAQVTPVDLFAAASPVPVQLQNALKTGPTVSTVLGTGDFQLLSKANGSLAEAVILHADAPKAPPIPVGRKAKRLWLLQGTTMTDVYHRMTFLMFDRGPAKLIEYRVRYADGKTRRFTALYGQHVGLINRYWPYPMVNWMYAVCFRSVSAPVGRDHKLYVQEWVNPRPRVAIDRIDIRLGADATDSGIVLIPAIQTVQ